MIEIEGTGWSEKVTHQVFRPRNVSPSAANVLLLLLLLVSIKTFSVHHGWSNFAHRLVTSLPTIAPCQIFKLSLINN